MVGACKQCVSFQSCVALISTYLQRAIAVAANSWPPACLSAYYPAARTPQILPLSFRSTGTADGCCVLEHGRCWGNFACLYRHPALLLRLPDTLVSCKQQ